MYFTWDVFSPADYDHQLAVGQVTERGQSLDVTLRHGGVRHGIDLLWLCHQQVRHYLCDWIEEEGGWGCQKKGEVKGYFTVMLREAHRCATLICMAT